MNTSKCSQTEINLSIVANSIVTNAGLVSYHLFCPFCADFYLFEFSFKDHLRAEHSDQLQKHFKCLMRYDENELNNSKSDKLEKAIFKDEFNYGCDLCGAMFKYAGLIPKHILNYHGPNYLKLWQREQQRKSDENKRNSDTIDSNGVDPSILYAKCSPGLSEIFERISTHDIDDDLTVDRTPLKSILKKSASKSARIISSPSSSCIRRMKGTSIVKRSSSARRVLRFDVANNSPNQLETIPFGQVNAELCMNVERTPRHKKKKTMAKLVRRILFGQCASQTKSHRKNVNNGHMVTSTPINFIDDALF